MANITVNDGICRVFTRAGNTSQTPQFPVLPSPHFLSLSLSLSFSTSDSLSYPFLPTKLSIAKMPVKWTPENDQLVRLSSVYSTRLTGTASPQNPGDARPLRRHQESS